MKEEDIRPQAIFDEYLRLASLDAAKYFGSAKREEICCPACGGNGTFIFEKHGFAYEECPNCQTIFVTPRPDVEAFLIITKIPILQNILQPPSTKQLKPHVEIDYGSQKYLK